MSFDDAEIAYLRSQPVARLATLGEGVAAGGVRVALVVDDLVSVQPFVARAVRVYGLADGPVERIGVFGPGTFLRITPTVSWSWNMAGEPAGDDWYPARRCEHAAPVAG